KVGEALVSTLDEHGSPTVVERGFIVPPVSKIGPIGADERQKIVAASVLHGQYETMVDRESAYEILKARAAGRAVPAGSGPAETSRTGGGGTPASAPVESGSGFSKSLRDFFFGSTGPRGGHREGAGEAMAKSVARSVGSQLGRQISRGVLGSIFGKGR